jgi:hypothetical protein
MGDERKPRVCQWGGFDAANFGDRLLPLIAKDQLSRRLPNLEMTCFAPTGGAALPPGSPPCFPLAAEGGYLPRERREYFARHFDAVLIGGGDLLRFDRLAPGYDGSAGDEPFLRPYHAFLEPFWDEAGPAVLWNAPGAPLPFERPRRALVRRACSRVGYLSVRDEVSRGYLLEAGVEDPVHTVPDTGVLVADLVRSRLGESKERRLLEARGVDPGGRRLLCFQCSPASCGRREELVARTLAGVADANDLEVVLLPLGHYAGDGDSLRSIRRAGGGRFALVEGSPLETAAMIGACDFFAGSSLHGNLTALSFGLPHLTINTRRLARLEGFVQLAGLEDLRITDWSDLGDAVEGLVSGPHGRWSEAGERLKALASDHFDRLAAEISEAASGGTPGTPPRRTAPDGGALLEVAGLLDRLEDERSASRATVRRLEAQIGELEESRRHAGGRDGEDPERLRRQLAERERKILDLGRELRNLDELRGALRDRTDRLAQREREVALLTHRLAVRNHMAALRMGGATPEHRSSDAGRGA